jgi:alkanesulfonate monooxygenase SsuD/methylene tetrahydromethanopterin reductase-like flavin-dependent oxidoreductase (luciferase family)
MDIGLFMVPFRLPEVDLQAGFDWDMQVIRWAEQFGLGEVWVGEHTTIGWEPVCSPELYLAAAIPQTERIRLATGANILANHNPVALAHRLMQLDHMSRGRLMVGIGAGSYATDLQIHGSEQGRAMMIEAAKILRAVWEADAPVRYDGRFWTLDMPPYDELLRGPYLKPYQRPHPPLAMAGLSQRSPTLAQAGLTGCIPMSFNVGREYLAGHWQSYATAAESVGNIPDRNQWRVAHNVMVADTDEEAMDLVLGGAMARTYREWMLPSYERAGLVHMMAPELGVSTAAEVSVEYLAEHKWLVGSPDTVVHKLTRDLDVSGGFGNLIAFTFDYLDQPDRYRRHLELLGTEVLPRVRDIVHRLGSTGDQSGRLAGRGQLSTR